MSTPIIPIDAINDDIAARKRRPALTSLGNPGEINRAVTEALARHIAPDDIARTIRGLLGASRTLKNGDELPDTRAQEAGVKLWLAYTVGLPVQRLETVNVNLVSCHIHNFG